jgi:hypothetical protein
MLVSLTAFHGANGDFLFPGWKILIGPFSNKASRTLHRPRNSVMRQLHDENGTKSLN